MLEPCSRAPGGLRNSTPASDAANEAVERFVASGMQAARLTEVEGDVDVAYMALWRVCAKKKWIGRVSAHKEAGRLYLVREDKA